MNYTEKVLKEFDEKFVNSHGHLDFTDEDGSYHLQKPTKIKSFLTTALEQQKKEILEELEKWSNVHIERLEKDQFFTETDMGEGFVIGQIAALKVLLNRLSIIRNK